MEVSSFQIVDLSAKTLREAIQTLRQFRRRLTSEISGTESNFRCIDLLGGVLSPVQGEPDCVSESTDNVQGVSSGCYHENKK